MKFKSVCNHDKMCFEMWYCPNQSLRFFPLAQAYALLGILRFGFFSVWNRQNIVIGQPRKKHPRDFDIMLQIEFSVDSNQIVVLPLCD